VELRKGLTKDELENYIEQLRASTITPKEFEKKKSSLAPSGQGPHLFVFAQGSGELVPEWSKFTFEPDSMYDGVVEGRRAASCFSHLSF
jgi:hypothetical protein